MASRCHRAECISVHFPRSTANMAAGSQTWNKFKNKIKELRQRKKRKKDSVKSATELETIVVQHLTAEVSGKAQKYSRVGPLQLVSFKDKISMSNIMKACMEHYGMYMLETRL